MLSLLSTLGGLLISGLPKLLDYFQNKADQAHELELARMQSERELALAKEGFIAQQRVEEIRTDQIAMQTDAQMTVAALDHDKMIIEKGIEMPTERWGRQAYRFRSMEVGDSFELACGEDLVAMNRVRTAASVYGTRHKKKFQTRRTEAGIRVWRTA